MAPSFRVCILLVAVSLASVVFAVDKTAVTSHRQWSKEKAMRWYNKRPWPCGFNYIPANAISYTEMWMDYSFDPKLIDAELKLTQDVGFNCLRVVLPYVVWEHDPDAFKARFEKFLKICDKRDLQVMPTFFDDCVFGTIKDPVYGKQPEVIEGWYANGWTPSPGHSMVRDRSQWVKLEKYVTDILNAHKTDARILCWDLYNEPTNSNMGDISVSLTEEVFRWARRVDPVQPLTVATWNGYHKLDEVIFRNSDIITFHAYYPMNRLAEKIRELKPLGRPIICTEWLNRGLDSIVETCLPVFFGENVGCMHWGLVNGKTQTDLGWGHRPGDPEPKVWQHDLYRPNLKPYRVDEIKLFEIYIRAAKRK